MDNQTEVSVECRKGFIVSEKHKTYYEIHSQSYFKEESIPLILLAGGPGLSFKTLTPLFKLAKKRQVIAYDQIGSGKSTRSENFKSLNINDFIEQFDSVVNELGITKYHIIGHSWGTILGVNLALEYPDNVESLIIHSGIADWKKCLLERQEFEKEQFPKELKQIVKQLNEGVKISADEMEKFTAKFNRLFYCRIKYPKFLIESLEDKDTGTNQLIWNPDKNKEMVNYNICDRLSEIKCPTLIISGKYDGISVGQADLFKSGIKNSKHVEFQNSAHYSHIEEELFFLEQVKTFIDSVDEVSE